MTTRIINSVDRLTGTNVNGNIKFSSNNKLSGIFTVKDFIMPNFMYNVNNNNNKVYFDESAVAKVATLTNGSYIFSELVTNIKTAMDLAGGQVYTVVYTSTTNKFTFSAAGNFGFTFFTVTANSAHKLLGISNLSNSAESTSKDSDNVADINPDKLIFLYFPDASNSINLSNGVTTSLHISTDGDFGDILRKSYGTDDISLSFNDKINISYRLHDEAGNDLVNTNGSEWTLILVKE